MSKIPKEWLNLEVKKDNCLTASDIIYAEKISNKWKTVCQYIDSKFPRIYNYNVSISSSLNHSVEFIKFNMSSNSMTCFLSFFVNVNNIPLSKLYLISIDSSMVRDRWVKLIPISVTSNIYTDDFEVDVKLDRNSMGLLRLRRSASNSLVEFRSNVSLKLNLINPINVTFYYLNNNSFVNVLPDIELFAYKDRNFKLNLSQNELDSFYRSVFRPDTLIFSDINHALNHLYDIGSNVNYLNDVIFRHNKLFSIFNIRDLFLNYFENSSVSVHGIENSEDFIVKKEITIHNLKTKNIHGFDGSHGFDDILVFLDLIILLLTKCGITFTVSAIKSIDSHDIDINGEVLGEAFITLNDSLEVHTHNSEAHALVTFVSNGFESKYDKSFLDNIVIFESDTVHYLNPIYKVESKLLKISEKSDLYDESKILDAHVGDICVLNDTVNRVFETYFLAELPITVVDNWVLLSVEFPVKSIAGYTEGDISLICNNDKKDVVGINESGLRDVGVTNLTVAVGNHIHGVSDIIINNLIISISSVCPDGFSPISVYGGVRFFVDGSKIGSVGQVEVFLYKKN